MPPRMRRKLWRRLSAQKESLRYGFCRNEAAARRERGSEVAQRRARWRAEAADRERERALKGEGLLCLKMHAVASRHSVSIVAQSASEDAEKDQPRERRQRSSGAVRPWRKSLRQDVSSNDASRKTAHVIELRELHAAMALE